jgi:hypothetical protein
LFRETWYRQLAIADRLIVETRKCVDGHKAYLRDLEQAGQDSSKARVLLALLEEALALMHTHRATILQKLAGCERQSEALLMPQERQRGVL